MKLLIQYIYILGLGLILFTVSCTDLTESPTTEITEQNFNPTEDDINSLTGPVYSNLRGMWFGWHGNLDLQEETADILITPTRPQGWYDGGTYVRLHQHTWGDNQSQPGNLYDNAYDGINAANRVIYQIESDEIPISDDLKTQTIAELKSMRAFYYYQLLDNHGNVPLVTDFTSEEVPEQSTRQEVYDFVVRELTENIPVLPETVDLSTYGRLTKWGAKAILADVYLNAEVYTGTPQWDKVIETTNDIIQADKYELEENYSDNFTRDNINSSENMFVVVYDEVNAPGSGFHMKTLKAEQANMLGLQDTPWGGSSSSPQFVDTYHEDDTRLEDTWFKGPQINSQGEEVIDFVKNVPGIQSEENLVSHGYPVKKYEIYDGMTSNSDVDVPIYRYADVLMMKAEALLRTESPNEAADLVTQVRQRAFEDPADAEVTGAELQSGSSYNYGWWEDGQVVNAEGGDDIEYGRMLDELGWEFAVEAHRRQDLIRFGVYTTKTWFNHTPNGEYRRIFPIPLNALNTNSNLEQNPGY
jgi:hypothetical protein